MAGKKHPGFKGAAASVAAKQGIPLANARAIIGSASHGASAEAVKANPRLRRVHGVGKGK